MSFQTIRTWVIPFVALLALHAADGIVMQTLPVVGSVALIRPSGDVYVTGSASPMSLPTTPGAPQPQAGGGTCLLPGGLSGLIPGSCFAAFIMRIRPGTSSQIVFSTYLGGWTSDAGTSIAVDPAGNVYVAGTTNGKFPVTPHAASTDTSSGRVFVAKLTADASRIMYATYIPSTAPVGAAIAVDGQGNAYVTGTTAVNHAFVAKISPDGSAFLYNKVLAGSQSDRGLAIAVDTSGNAIVAGSTNSHDFPVSSIAFQPKLAGTANAFITRLDSGGAITSSSYLGGSGSDAAATVSLDPSGNIYVAGVANSLDFPTKAGSFMPAPLVPMWGSSPGGFAAKISPDMHEFIYSTYVYSDASGVRAITPGATGDAFVVASTGAGFPVTVDAPQPCFAGTSDSVLAHLGKEGNLVEATYAGPMDWPVSPAVIGMDGSLNLITNRLPSTGMQASLQATLVSIKFGGPASSCVSPTALNAATFSGVPPGHAPLDTAPGELISITGFGMGPEAGVNYVPGPDGSAPVELAGVQVLFDGQPAPLLYSQSRQLNAIVPFELAGKSSTTMTVKYKGAAIGTVQLPLGEADPELFRQHVGYSTQAAALNEDGTVNGPSNPAKPGSVVQLFGTGFGSMSSSVPAGKRNPVVPSIINVPASATVGMLTAEVLYLGAAPGLLSGIGQINIRIPAEATDDNNAPVSVSIIIDSGSTTISSRNLATIAVHR